MFFRPASPADRSPVIYLLDKYFKTDLNYNCDKTLQNNYSDINNIYNYMCGRFSVRAGARGVTDFCIQHRPVGACRKP